MGPANPPLAWTPVPPSVNRGSAPQWSKWKWVMRTASMAEPGAPARERARKSGNLKEKRGGGGLRAERGGPTQLR